MDVVPDRTCQGAGDGARKIGQGRIVKGPKSKAGKRDVFLSDRAMAALIEHMETYIPGPVATPAPKRLGLRCAQSGPLV